MMVVISWYFTAGNFIYVCRLDRSLVKKYVAQWMLLKTRVRAFSCLVSSYLMLEKLVNMLMKSSIRLFYL